MVEEDIEQKSAAVTEDSYSDPKTRSHLAIVGVTCLVLCFYLIYCWLYILYTIGLFDIFTFNVPKYFELKQNYNGSDSGANVQKSLRHLIRGNMRKGHFPRYANLNNRAKRYLEGVEYRPNDIRSQLNPEILIDDQAGIKGTPENAGTPHMYDVTKSSRGLKRNGFATDGNRVGTKHWIPSKLHFADVKKLMSGSHGKKLYDKPAWRRFRRSQMAYF